MAASEYQSVAGWTVCDTTFLSTRKSNVSITEHQAW